MAQAQLRAIEEGLPIARVTPTGISAIIDAHGRIVASVGPQHAAATLSLRMPPPLPPTLFSRYAHWTSLAFGALLLVCRRRDAATGIAARDIRIALYGLRESAPAL